MSEGRTAMDKQSHIKFGMAVSVVFMLLVGRELTTRKLWAPPLIDNFESRMLYVIHWLIVPALCLLVGIIAMGNQRFLTSEGIEGTRTPPTRSMEINLRYNQNTLEQAFLASIAYLGLGISLPHEYLGLIGVFATFAIGRILFWIGYSQKGFEERRAVGMLLTFLPTVASYTYLVNRYVAGYV